MIKSRTLAAALAVGALAATPAFAIGGGANWNTGFQPTWNNQAYGNQGPTGRGGPNAPTTRTATADNAGTPSTGTPSTGTPSTGGTGANAPQTANNPGSPSAPAASPIGATTQGVQQQLANMGLYHGAIDGKWGPETSRALAMFQSQHGLRATGAMNFATAQRLGVLGQAGGNNPGPATASNNNAGRTQGRSGAGTAPGYSTMPGRSSASANATSTTPGGLYNGGYTGGNPAITSDRQLDTFSATPGSGSTSGAVATSPPGFFGYGNMSNGFNAATGR